MKSFDENKMIGWAIAMGVAGSFVAVAVGAVFTGTEPSAMIRFWMSLWWLWVPAGLAVGLWVGRNSS